MTSLEFGRSLRVILEISQTVVKTPCKPALPLLEFSPKILGFSIRPWDMGFFMKTLAFFSDFFQDLWLFWGFSNFTKKYIYLSGFWPKRGENLKTRVDD